jgi:hypothetical protein
MASEEHVHHTLEDVKDSSEMYQDRPVPHHLQDQSQRFCVLSIVAPEGLNQKHKDLAIRVFGCKASRAEANRWSKALRDDNPYFDVYVLDCHQWAVLPPDIGKIKDIQGTNERLQDIYAQFKEENIARTKDIEKRMEMAHRDRKDRRNEPIESIESEK